MTDPPPPYLSPSCCCQTVWVFGLLCLDPVWVHRNLMKRMRHNTAAVIDDDIIFILSRMWMSDVTVWWMKLNHTYTSSDLVSTIGLQQAAGWKEEGGQSSTFSFSMLIWTLHGSSLLFYYSLLMWGWVFIHFDPIWIHYPNPSETLIESNQV